MPFHIILLTLFAALLHASWNALLRGGKDKAWSMTIMCIAVAFVSVAAMPFVSIPAIRSWPYALSSAILHVGYNVFLVKSYKTGGLGQMYPVARGSSPLLVTLGAAAFAHERISIHAFVGVLLVSGGIMSLVFYKNSRIRSGILNAFATGCFIAAYTVTDGIGVRLSGNAMGYTAWMCAAWGILMPAVYIGQFGVKRIVTVRPGLITSLFGGVVSLLAYGLVIYAMSHAPMGSVSALRETGVLFAMLIGYFFLGEALTLRKALSGIVITVGTIIIS